MTYFYFILSLSLTLMFLFWRSFALSRFRALSHSIQASVFSPSLAAHYLSREQQKSVKSLNTRDFNFNLILLTLALSLVLLFSTSLVHAHTQIFRYVPHPRLNRGSRIRLFSSIHFLNIILHKLITYNHRKLSLSHTHAPLLVSLTLAQIFTSAHSKS